MSTAIVTNHAKQRTKDRLGVSKKIADKIANKALEHGVTHALAKGKLKAYLDKLYLSHKSANNLRVYNRKVYLFDRTVLITVLNLPNNLINAADKLQRQKEK